MKLRDFLLYETKVGDLVWFCISGWYTGCTVIDHEDLFISSLNPDMLERKVKKSGYEMRDWTIKPVLVVEI